MARITPHLSKIQDHLWQMWGSLWAHPSWYLLLEVSWDQGQLFSTLEPEETCGPQAPIAVNPPQIWTLFWVMFDWTSPGSVANTQRAPGAEDTKSDHPSTLWASGVMAEWQSEGKVCHNCSYSLFHRARPSVRERLLLNPHNTRV